MKMPYNFFLLILFLLVLHVIFCIPLSAKDFGVIWNQTLGFSNADDGLTFSFPGVLIPRFSHLFNSGAFFASLGLAYSEDGFVPELLRTDYAWFFDQGEFRVGRMEYQDPLGYVANGLFDGVNYTLSSGFGIFNAGAWYTGLLYKKRINIAMTKEALIFNDAAVDYKRFSDTYFASRHIVAALSWEHPAIKETVRLRTALMMQYALSNQEGKLHSQYIIAKIGIPLKAFYVEAGGCLEFIEQKNRFGIAAASDVEISWMRIPTPIEDKLSLLFRYSSGMVKDSSFSAFQPVNVEFQGNILQAKLSGLSILCLSYTARLFEKLGTEIQASYYIRNDLGTYIRNESEGYLLGPEFYGKLFFSPYSDIYISAGCGAFLPSMGNVLTKTGTLWKAELSCIIALY